MAVSADRALMGLAERLAELADLHTRGLLNDAEYVVARETAIKEGQAHTSVDRKWRIVATVLGGALLVAAGSVVTLVLWDRAHGHNVASPPVTSVSLLVTTTTVLQPSTSLAPTTTAFDDSTEYTLPVVDEPLPADEGYNELHRTNSTRLQGVLVPQGWQPEVVDGGGPGSSATWRNPRDPNASVEVGTGVEMGVWFNQRTGAIDPTELLPRGASKVAVNRWTYRFAAPAPRGYISMGVWTVEPALANPAEPSGFEIVQVTFPAAKRFAADRIVEAFIAMAPLPQ